MSKNAELRVCASCEWIYRGKNSPCPHCGFVSYGARFFYGNKCYQYESNQKPWFDKQMSNHAVKLHRIIKETKSNESLLHL